MPLLHDEDYQGLHNMGINFSEDEASRFFIFRNYPLPSGIYNVDCCDVLVVIPPNYNHAGNDMFWTCPHLTRLDQKIIPNACLPSGGDNRHFEGKIFCRWSRHWNEGSSVWKPAVDDISTIQRRIEWALKNPDANHG